jgi:hypothetical protein
MDIASPRTGIILFQSRQLSRTGMNENNGYVYRLFKDKQQSGLYQALFD